MSAPDEEGQAAGCAAAKKAKKQRQKARKQQSEQPLSCKPPLSTSPFPIEALSTPSAFQPNAPQAAELQQHQLVATGVDPQTLLWPEGDVAADSLPSGTCANAGDTAGGSEVDRLSAEACPPKTRHSQT